MTDTGSFRYPSVNSNTHTIIAELLKTGIIPSEIHGAVYDNYSIDRLSHNELILRNESNSSGVSNGITYTSSLRSVQTYERQ